MECFDFDWGLDSRFYIFRSEIFGSFGVEIWQEKETNRGPGAVNILEWQIWIFGVGDAHWWWVVLMVLAWKRSGFGSEN